jgi:NADP-dependent 3-hydroxy acid dehydrogenase YdfG
VTTTADPSAFEQSLSSLHSLRTSLVLHGKLSAETDLGQCRDSVPSMSETSRIALVTGASSGIGAATVRALAAAGFDVVAAARRVERCEAVAQEVGGRALRLDVADPDSVAALVESVPEVSVVVNNAGGALGLEPVAEADEENWRQMYETNVLGVMRVTKALLPALERSSGHIVVVGSVAGLEVYPGGAGYTAAKHAANAVTRSLRLELLGKDIRVSEVAPGMVETEFSLVRFEGDEERAAQVYEGTNPLKAEDVADAIAYVVTRPPHVDVDYLSIKPTDQATARDVHRR